MKYREFIENNIVRCEAGYRGGGIELKLDDIIKKIKDPRMAAYQNYLGGGMLGAIQENHNFDDSLLGDEEKSTLYELADNLKRYFHELTNHEEDEWECETYEHNQTKAVSAY